MKDQKEYEQKLKAAEETLGAVQSCVKGAQTFLEASSQNKDAMIANLEKSVAVHKQSNKQSNKQSHKQSNKQTNNQSDEQTIGRSTLQVGACFRGQN